MKLKTAKRIRELFEEIEREFPDKSDAFLFEMTRQRAEMMHWIIDGADIAIALAKTTKEP